MFQNIFINKFIFSLCESKKQKEIEAAMVDELITDCICPPSCLKMICCDQVMITQYENDSVASERNFLSFISAAIEGDSEIDLWHIKDEGLRNTVSTLINEYKPLEKPRSTDLKMKVIFRDNIPVSQRSRRIPFADQKIVDNQIDEWLKDRTITAKK